MLQSLKSILGKVFTIRPKIKPQESDEVSVVTTPYRRELLDLIETFPLDDVVKDPNLNILILTVYNESIDRLLSKIANKPLLESHSLIGVSVHRFFSDASMRPSVALERLVKMIEEVPSLSANVEHDIQVLVRDITMLKEFWLSSQS